MKKIVIIILSIILPLLSFAQKEAPLIRKGNKAYKEGDFKNAEINYRKSLEKNNKSLKGTFNLADALYEQEDFENAQQMFDALSKNIEDPMQKAEAFHNLGNSFLSTEKYQESIEAYKNALRNNPNDEDTRYNLEYARQKLQEQQQQQQQNQDQDKDQQDQQDKQDQQDQQNQQDKKDQEDKQDQQDQKDQQQNKDQNNKDQQKNQQQQPRQISKQDAERMLQALKNEEKKTIEKLKKEQAKAAQVKTSEKDW